MLGTKAREYVSSFAECARERGIGSGLIMAGGSLWAKARYGLGVQDYYAFRLHDRPLARWKDYRGFYYGPIGLLRVVNRLEAKGGAHFDKLGETAALLAAGVPVLPVRHVVSTRELDLPFSILRTREQVADALTAERPRELFVKPNDEIRGKGAFALSVDDRGGLSVAGEPLPAAELADRLLGADSPMLIQDRHATHELMRPYGGDFGLSTIRTLTALTEDGPVLVSASQKVLGGPSVTDHFHGGQSGNMLVPIDVATGRYGAVLGMKRGNRFLIDVGSDHAVTGARMEGEPVPMFDEIVRVAHALALAFPDSPMLGSDVAATADGVRVVEVNREWGCSLKQAAGEHGIMAVFREWVPRLRLDDERRDAALALLASDRPPGLRGRRDGD